MKFPTVAFIFAVVALASTSLGEPARSPALSFDVKSVRSGAWSDPAIWEPARVPRNGERVLVSPQTRVAYDVASDDVIRLLQVAGELHFARDRNTTLNVGLLKVQNSENCSENGFRCDLPAITEAGEPSASPATCVPNSRLHSAEQTLQFNRDIRPILSDKCFACHGTDAKRRDSGRRLDLAEGAYRETEGVIAIKPGNLEKSDAWVRSASGDKDEVMPPPKSHKTLSNEEKDTIRRWILQGAADQKHWAFEPPVKVAPPPVKAAERVRNPIDAFAFARLDKLGLAPSPEADKATLIRRATLAITGLPPTPPEVTAFLADAAPDAYARLVDRLLASPRFGEHMAHWWLDLARYADTHGLHLDNERQTWLYRDWVIGAFNRNLPFNEFTIEQLAGDQLPIATPDQIVASGFNRCNVTTGEGGAINEEFLYRYAVDRTATTAATWMALTAGCAVCHDHKFDPLTQKEFYQLYAFFNSAADPAMDSNTLLTAPVLKVEAPEQTKRLADLDVQGAAAEKRLMAAVEKIAYKDLATVVPLPPAKEQETMLVDDDFPAGAKVTPHDRRDHLTLDRAIPQIRADAMRGQNAGRCKKLRQL